MDYGCDDYSEETLQQIEEYAGLFYELDKIAIIMELEHSTLKDSFESEGIIYKRYMKGFLIAECAIRKSIIEHAKSGSSPAQQMALKLMLGAETLDSI